MSPMPLIFVSPGNVAQRFAAISIICLQVTAIYACLGLPGPVWAQDMPFNVDRVTDHVYRFSVGTEPDTSNSMFIVTDRGVIAFDSMWPLEPPATQNYAKAIRAVAPDAPLLAIVYSHHHADHSSGADVLRSLLNSSAPIISHENARAAMLSKPRDTQTPAEITFSGDRLVLAFGEPQIELFYPGPTHTDNLIVASVPSDGVLYVVDIMTHDRLNVLQFDFYFPEYFSALHRILDRFDFNRVIFGHGPMGDRASVQRQIAFHDALYAAVATAIAEGKTIDEAVAEIRLPEFEYMRKYSQWLDNNIRAVYEGLSP